MCVAHWFTLNCLIWGLYGPQVLECKGVNICMKLKFSSEKPKMLLGYLPICWLSDCNCNNGFLVFFVFYVIYPLSWWFRDVSRLKVNRWSGRKIGCNKGHLLGHRGEYRTKGNINHIRLQSSHHRKRWLDSTMLWKTATYHNREFQSKCQLLV